jgi:hypothetical protein
MLSRRLSTGLQILSGAVSTPNACNIVSPTLRLPYSMPNTYIRDTGLSSNEDPRKNACTCLDPSPRSRSNKELYSLILRNEKSK